MNNPLLAKSESRTTLQQHITDCLQIEEQLRDCFPNLPIKECSFFWELVRISVCFHDIGKCHKEFQKLLYGRPNAWNNRRHELFSIPFVYHSNLSEEQKEFVVYAIAGHHKDLDELNNIVLREYGYRAQEQQMPDNLEGFTADCGSLLCNKAWKILASYGFLRKNDESITITKIIRNLKELTFPVDSYQYLQRLLLVGYVKQCDHLASAGINHLNKLNSSQFAFLHSYNFYNHQKQSSQCVGNAFLSAPTGSGKTETAMLWLENQIKTTGQGRTFYVLPYTASINAMYERLSEHMGKKSIGMIHGKLAQYIDSKFEDGINEGELNVIKENYKTLVTPLKVVTPFQLLKNVFGLRHFEKGLSEWCGGFFIFDEIHAYDSRTFAQIVVLLEICTKWLSGKVFIMTATMPTHMLQILNNIIDTHHIITADEHLYDSFNRHFIVLENGLLIDSIINIQKDIDLGKKVLVVCNTVEQSQKVYKLLRCQQKILLHSSFSATDRSIKEQRLQNEEIQVLVGTQAIEVSLDIDYDTIYTEPAPIDSLIQRFGRVNRKCRKGVCLCHVFRIPNEKDKYIYNYNIVEKTITVLEEVNNAILREKCIQKMIDEVYPCFNEYQQKEFDITYTGLKLGIENKLHPLHYDKKSEEDFYHQFDGIKVLPISLIDQYRTMIEKKQFVKAEGLLVSIRESRFFYLFRNRDVYTQRICYECSDENIANKNVLIINWKYDYELGLQIDNKEMNSYMCEL